MTTEAQARAREVGNITRKQIGVQGFMTLGASDLAYLLDADKKPGLSFHARIKPFLSDGERGQRARRMTVTVVLNAKDLYDVKVGYIRNYAWVTHYKVEDLGAEYLPRLMVALDYDGDDVLNGRYL